MAANQPASPTASANSGAEVVVRTLDGNELRGSVQNFNPRIASFVLRALEGAHSVSFDAVKSVMFLRAPGKPAASFTSNARLVTVRFNDQSTLQGVAENFGGPRSGVFLVPPNEPNADRVYVPSSAIRDVLSVHRLGEILGEQKRVTLEMVQHAVARDPELRHDSPTHKPPRRRATDREPAAEPARERESSGSGTRLGEILVEQGFISHEELGSALVAAKRNREHKLGEILIEMGYTSYKMIAIALSIQYNCPFVSLLGHSLDTSLKDLLRREEALRWQIIPVNLESGVLTVAIADPTQTDHKVTLQRRSGASLVEVVATPQDIQRAIGILYPQPG